MGWVTDTGDHEGFVDCLFADGMAGSGWSGGGITITTAADGTEIPYGQQPPSRPASEVVGWRVGCNCNYGQPGRDRIWHGQPWTRAAEEDIDHRRLCVTDEQALEMVFDDEGPGRFLYAEWERDHLGAYHDLAGVAAAAHAVAQARRQLDTAVAMARVAGASWADVGKAAGISRQSAHERWGQEPSPRRK